MPKRAVHPLKAARARPGCLDGRLASQAAGIRRDGVTPRSGFEIRRRPGQSTSGQAVRARGSEYLLGRRARGPCSCTAAGPEPEPMPEPGPEPDRGGLTELKSQDG